MNEKQRLANRLASRWWRPENVLFFIFGFINTIIIFKNYFLNRFTFLYYNENIKFLVSYIKFSTLFTFNTFKINEY